MNESRSFLSTAIASALDFEVMSPEDVIRHITMDVLAHHLPVSLKARLLTAALEAEVMNAMLVLDTLGVDALAEHAPAHLLWECVAAAAKRSLGASSSESAKPGSALPFGDPPSPMPLSPVTNTKPAAISRKPNRTARASSRVRAGATSRSSLLPAVQPPAPIPDDDDEEDSAFDVDTRVGGDPSLELDAIEDTSYDPSDEVTTHGHKP